MGILTNGIFGGFVNKTGSLVGKNHKGQNVITGLPHVNTRVKTLLQSNQNLKFEVLSRFTSPIKALLTNGFKHISKKNTGYSEAFSYNFKHALLGQDGNYAIDYAAVLYSKGNLEWPFGPKVILINDASILFTWQLTNHCYYDDLATFMVYNETQGLFVAKVDAVKRSICKYQLDLPAGFRSGKIHCYMSFRSVKYRKVSNSVYISYLII